MKLSEEQSDLNQDGDSQQTSQGTASTALSGWSPPMGSRPAIDGFDEVRMLRSLLSNLDGMIYRCRDDDQWSMEFISEGCRRLTGYDTDDFLLNNRISYESITHPTDRKRVRADIQLALRHRHQFDCEYRILHASGETRWVWERGSGVYDKSGKLTAVEGIIQDVSERHRSSRALREAERRYYNLFENAIEGIFRTTLD